MRHLLSFLCIYVLTACATSSSPTYDPQAKESAARVVGKMIVGSREQRKDGEVYGAIPIGGVFVPLSGSSTRTAISLYEYQVVDNEKNTTIVRSEAPFFDIGQCVKLMTANNPSYPRIAYGAECVGF